MSSRSRSRSSSEDGRPSKRQKLSASAFKSVGTDIGTSPFAPGLMSESNVKHLADQYTDAQPYKHIVIDKIFTENLLTKVKDEILEHLSFTEKETDIYKVR